MGDEKGTRREREMYKERNGMGRQERGVMREKE